MAPFTRAPGARLSRAARGAPHVPNPGRKVSRLIVTAALMVLAPFSAQAQEDLAVAIKAASCNACHGPGGRSEAGIPPLAGRNADEMFRSMTEFKAGTRPAYVMHHHTRGYTEEELRAIAGWFARQPTQGKR